MKKLILAVILVVILTLAVPVTALAGTGTDTTTVSGTNPTTYTLVPPPAISLDIFSAGANSATGKTVKAQTNDNTVSTVKLEVRDNKITGNISYMVKTDGTKLSQKFQVKGGALTGWTDLPMAAGTTLELVTSGALSAGPPYSYERADFGVNQPITSLAAEVGGDYSITLYFVATFS